MEIAGHKKLFSAYNDARILSRNGISSRDHLILMQRSGAANILAFFQETLKSVEKVFYC